MKTIQETNATLVKMTTNIKLAKDIRKASVNDVISLTLDFAKENKETFSTKKNAISVFTKNMLGDASIDTFTKRAVKIAKAILVDGYKMKKEELSLAQMEQLICFRVDLVNDLMDAEDYLMDAKELISTAKVSKSGAVFSKAKAKNI